MKARSTILIAIAFFFFSCSETRSTKEKNKVSEIESLDIRIGTDLTNLEKIFIDKRNGDTLFAGERFFKAKDFKNGYSIVSKKVNGKTKTGVINLKGKKIIPIEYDGVFATLQNEYFQIMKKVFVKKKAIYEERYGYADITGKEIIAPIYKLIQPITDNRVTVKNGDNKWGVIDLSGKEIAPFKYDRIGSWRNDLAVINLKNKYGFINKKGEIIIDLKYSFATGFEQGVALCKMKNKYGLINTKDSVISDFIYDEYKTIVDVYDDGFNDEWEKNERFSMKEGYIILKKNNKWGYVNTKGETVIPFEFDIIGIPPIGSHNVAITKDNKNGQYNIKEKKIKWATDTK